MGQKAQVADKIHEKFALAGLMGERILDLDAVGTKLYMVGHLIGDLTSIVGGNDFL